MKKNSIQTIMLGIGVGVIFFSGVLITHAAKKKEPKYVYKGSLMNQIRWQCATDCMHGSKVITGYVNIKKCTNKCIAKPPQSTRWLASEMQKICKKGPSDSEERRFCQEVSHGRDDFAEWMINKWNGTKTGCPLGATLKGKKCVCPKGTKLNSEHTSCFEEVNEEKMKESLDLVQELLVSSPTPSVSAEGSPLLGASAQSSPAAVTPTPLVISTPIPSSTPAPPWYMKCGKGCPGNFTCRDISDLFTTACAIPNYNSDRSEVDCKSLGGRKVRVWCVKENT